MLDVAVQIKQGCTWPLQRQEHLHKGTGRQQLGLGAGKKKAIFAQDFATAPVRAWGEAGGTEATTESRSHAIIFNIFFTHSCFILLSSQTLL